MGECWWFGHFCPISRFPLLSFLIPQSRVAKTSRAPCGQILPGQLGEPRSAPPLELSKVAPWLDSPLECHRSCTKGCCGRLSHESGAQAHWHCGRLLGEKPRPDSIGISCVRTGIPLQRLAKKRIFRAKARHGRVCRSEHKQLRGSSRRATRPRWHRIVIP